MLQIPDSWRKVLGNEFNQPYFQKLQAFIEQERVYYTIYPPAMDVFNAFFYTDYEQVRVLLLGQDPYHDTDQAHGLCFSVRSGVKLPRSLVNIFKELQDDIGCPIPSHGDLTSWAKQGILMLNTVLTVRANTPNSHSNRGWETFTDAVIQAVNDKSEPVIFVLWGKNAQEKLPLINTDFHKVIIAAHPSPFSARKGFFGSKPFSKINEFLREFGQPEIDWRID